MRMYLSFINEHFIRREWTGMAQPGIGKKTHTKVEDQSSLKGTLASVFLLGFFLIVTWVGVYFLFVDRF